MLKGAGYEADQHILGMGGENVILEYIIAWNISASRRRWIIEPTRSELGTVAESCMRRRENQGG